MHVTHVRRPHPNPARIGRGDCPRGRRRDARLFPPARSGRRTQGRRVAGDRRRPGGGRAAAEADRRAVSRRRILGEEFGAADGTSGYQWVLDPIDGTKSFIHGVPLYTTLVAVLAEDEPQIGVIHAPACGETVYAAKGGGCWYIDARTGDVSPEPARVSSVRQLQRVLLLTTEVASFSTAPQDGRDARVPGLAAGGPARAHLGRWLRLLMVATGRAEVMIDPVMNLWDAAPLQTVIEEAGGHSPIGRASRRSTPAKRSPPTAW